MPALHPQLELDRCPHCSVANPNLSNQKFFETKDHAGGMRRVWGVYVCSNCGGVVTAWALKQGVIEWYQSPVIRRNASLVRRVLFRVF